METICEEQNTESERSGNECGGNELKDLKAESKLGSFFDNKKSRKSGSKLNRPSFLLSEMTKLKSEIASRKWSEEPSD